MQKGKMGNKGLNQGNMAPVVDDYQKPSSAYSQTFPNKTTEYIARHNKIETKDASDVKKQAYQGRYS